MAFTSILCLLLSLSIVLAKQMVLVRQNDQYVFKIEVGNLKINLHPKLSLKDKMNWIKQQNCKQCFKIQNKQVGQAQQQSKHAITQKFNNTEYECTKSCFDGSSQEYGLRCSNDNNNCRVQKQNVEITYQNGLVMKGKLINIKGKGEKQKEVYDELKLVLVDRVLNIQNRGGTNGKLAAGIGEIESEQQKQKQKSKSKQKKKKKGKSEKKGLQDQGQYDKQQQQQKQNSGDKGDMNGGSHKEQSVVITMMMGQYSIWGEGSQLQERLVLKNNKKQISVYGEMKEVEGMLLFPPSQFIEIPFEQTQTQLELTQIKLADFININHPDQIAQDRQFPVHPLQKGFFNLDTEALLLPSKYLNSTISFLLNTYFSQPQLNNLCTYSGFIITCQKTIQLQKINYLQLQLIFNGITVAFPISVLIKNCKHNKCQIKLGQSSSSNFQIGTFFFDVFAANFDDQTQNIKLYRLNNQWNKMYSKNQKHKKQNYNIFWWFFSSIFSLIYLLLKIIFYLAVFSLLINCIYHWRKVLQWIVKVFRKVSKRRNSDKQPGQLFQEDEDLQTTKDTSKLIRSLKSRQGKRKFFEDVQNISTEQVVNRN